MAAKTATLPDVLTIQEAADHLHCNPITIRRMIARGELRAYRVGKARMVRIDARSLARIMRPVTNLADLVGAGDGE
ncbi:helix-turn-helix domain-containing protein [Actinomyces sp.]|uniref:helix-turn-helix domain-containing protein n=1 Tax=Actinomyces sp. TaxID=29317 RepID=UPI00289C0AE1|nr:helix-turn-helix domain-containing protein [Actinomyces sp.]